MTKGKWEVNREALRIIINGEPREVVCTLNSRKTDEEAIANAELIALAGNLAQEYNLEALPELVKVCEKAVQQLWTCNFDSDNIRNRIESALSSIRVKK